MDTEHKGNRSDSELFVCPWYASVIVEAYQNLGAQNEQREEEKRDKKCTWLLLDFIRSYLSSVYLLHTTPTPPPLLPRDTLALIFKELWVHDCRNHV